MPASLRSALATTTRQYESLVAHVPPVERQGGLFGYIDRSRCVPARMLRQALALATMPGQYRALVAHGPLPKVRGAPFFCTVRPECQPASTAGPHSHLKVAMPT